MIVHAIDWYGVERRKAVLASGNLAARLVARASNIEAIHWWSRGDPPPKKIDRRENLACIRRNGSAGICRPYQLRHHKDTVVQNLA